MGYETNKSELIQVEISIEKMAILFESGLICAAEVNCLTTQSKQCISDLCLRSCAKKIGCNITLFSEYSSIQPIYKKR